MKNKPPDAKLDVDVAADPSETSDPANDQADRKSTTGEHFNCWRHENGVNNKSRAT